MIRWLFKRRYSPAFIATMLVIALLAQWIGWPAFVLAFFGGIAVAAMEDRLGSK